MSNPHKVETDSGFDGFPVNTGQNESYGTFDYTDLSSVYWRYVCYVRTDLVGGSNTLQMARTSDGITFTKQDQAHGPDLGTLTHQTLIVYRGRGENKVYCTYVDQSTNTCSLAIFDFSTNLWTINGGGPDATHGGDSSTNQYCFVGVTKISSGNVLLLRASFNDGTNTNTLEGWTFSGGTFTLKATLDFGTTYPGGGATSFVTVFGGVEADSNGNLFFITLIGITGPGSLYTLQEIHYNSFNGTAFSTPSGPGPIIGNPSGPAVNFSNTSFGTTRGTSIPCYESSVDTIAFEMLFNVGSAGSGPVPSTSDIEVYKLVNVSTSPSLVIEDIPNRGTGKLSFGSISVQNSNWIVATKIGNNLSATGTVSFWNKPLSGGSWTGPTVWYDITVSPPLPDACEFEQTCPLRLQFLTNSNTATVLTFFDVTDNDCGVIHYFESVLSLPGVAVQLSFGVKLSMTPNSSSSLPPPPGGGGGGGGPTVATHCVPDNNP